MVLVVVVAVLDLSENFHTMQHRRRRDLILLGGKLGRLLVPVQPDCEVGVGYCQ